MFFKKVCFVCYSLKFVPRYVSAYRLLSTPCNLRWTTKQLFCKQLPNHNNYPSLFFLFYFFYFLNIRLVMINLGQKEKKQNTSLLIFCFFINSHKFKLSWCHGREVWYYTWTFDSWENNGSVCFLKFEIICSVDWKVQSTPSTGLCISDQM